MRGCLLLLVLGLLLGCGTADTDGSLETTAQPDRAGEVLIAGSNMMHPPFSSWDENGAAIGIEVEIVEAAARELGVHVRWVERPFPELLSAIENGELDIAVSTIGITDERKIRVAFSEPYHETQIVALVRKDESSPRLLEDLATARIGADEATTSYPAARRQWPSATLIGKVDDGMTWPQMVDEGTIDGFVVDASDQERLESASGITLSRIEQPLSAEYFGVAMTPGEEDLREAVDRAVRRVTTRAPTEARPGSAAPWSPM